MSQTTDRVSRGLSWNPRENRRSAVRQEPDPGDGDPREWLQSLAARRRRFGYRRLGILPEREGIHMNRKNLYRLYSEGAGRRPPPRPQTRDRDAGADGAAGRAEPRWSPDFVSNALDCGRHFRILAIVDDFTREALAWVTASRANSTLVTPPRQACRPPPHPLRQSAAIRPAEWICGSQQVWREMLKESGISGPRPLCTQQVHLSSPRKQRHFSVKRLDGAWSRGWPGREGRGHS
jgi:hypothetical protein